MYGRTLIATVMSKHTIMITFPDTFESAMARPTELRKEHPSITILDEL